MSLSKDNETWREEMFTCKSHLSLLTRVYKAIDLTREHIKRAESYKTLNKQTLASHSERWCCPSHFSPFAFWPSKLYCAVSILAASTYLTHKHTHFVNYSRKYFHQCMEMKRNVHVAYYVSHSANQMV